MIKRFLFFLLIFQIPILIMIYLDNNATTPCDEAVVKKVLPFFTEKFANPSSTTYAEAWQVDEAVKLARIQVADILKAEPSEITFTSGATESINMVLKGLVDLYQSTNPDKKLHIISCITEHSAVIDTCHFLEKRGVQISLLPVRNDGTIDISELKSEIKEQTILVSIALANNETGVIQPIEEIAGICKEKKILLMSDTTQAVGKIETNLRDLGIDIACISGHKIYGIKGSGAVYMSRKNPRVRLSPLLHGGGQENEKRSGTLNVPGIVALGAAADLCVVNMKENILIKKMRDELEQKLLLIPGAKLNVNPNIPRLPNTINVGFKNIKAEKIIRSITQKLAISLGSACNAGTGKPSRVLQAMNVSNDYLNGSIRISLGRFTSQQDIETAAEILSAEINQLMK